MPSWCAGPSRAAARPHLPVASCAAAVGASCALPRCCLACGAELVRRPKQSRLDFARQPTYGRGCSARLPCDPITPAEASCVRERYAEGWGSRAIANRLGRGKKAVETWMLEHDMEPSARARRADDYAWAREMIRENPRWSSYKLAEVTGIGQPKAADLKAEERAKASAMAQAPANLLRRNPEDGALLHGA